jgi:chemotaxis protein histidine kinase CheA
VIQALGNWAKLLKNVKAAFESAHTLKGLAANMGLDSMLDIVVELVEPLRNGMIDGLSPTYERLIAEKKTYDNIVNG